MNKQPSKLQANSLFSPRTAVFIALFALIAVTVLIIVRAAGSSVSVGDGAQLSGSVSYKTDDATANGSYLSFGAANNEDGIVPFTPADMPAYPSVPAISPPTVTKVTNYAQLMAAINNDAVRTVVLGDGTYASPRNSDGSYDPVIIYRKTNKTLIAENKHKAIITHDAYLTNGIHIGSSEDISIIGIVFNKPLDYAIKVGGQDYPAHSGSNERVVIEHIKITDSGRGGIGVNNGWGSSCEKSPPPKIIGISKDITLRYNEFYEFGMRFPVDNYGIGLSEAIYIGSGGNCQEKDTTYDVKIISNYFDGTNMKGAGEAIGAKTNSRDLLIENNFIKNWQLTENTDHSAISVWHDAGLPMPNRANFTAGEKGIVIRGNVIDGVKNYLNYSSTYGRGISAGHQALIENNTVKNTTGAAI